MESRAPVSDEQVLEAVSKFGSGRKAAASLGIGQTTIRHRLARIKLKELEPGFKVAEIPSEEIPTEELIAQRKSQFERRRNYEEATKLIRVRVKTDGPVGIVHFGDPHLDDNGTDISAVEQHCAIVRDTPGMFAACVGDLTNNWIGRLARLYAEQSTSAVQAWQLADWFMAELKGHLLYLIGGNHDAWSGAGDPLKWIARQNDALYKSSECRIELQLPNKQRPRINARHDFSGHSMWNPAHGPLKALTMGVRDHIAIAGHKHESAYSLLKCPETGITMHAIKVSTYKTFDRFAKERGFRDQTLSPCAVTVFNTEALETSPDYIKVFWDPVEGADYLTHLRARYENRVHSVAAAVRRVRGRARAA